MIKGSSFDVLHLQPKSTAEVHARAGPIQYVFVFHMQSLLDCLLGRCYHGSSQTIYISKKRVQDAGHVMKEQPGTVCQKANIRSGTFCLSPVRINDTKSDEEDAGYSQRLDRIAEIPAKPEGRRRRLPGGGGCSCSSLLYFRRQPKDVTRTRTVCRCVFMCIHVDKLDATC